MRAASTGSTDQCLYWYLYFACRQRGVWWGINGAVPGSLLCDEKGKEGTNQPWCSANVAAVPC